MKDDQRSTPSRNVALRCGVTPRPTSRRPLRQARQLGTRWSSWRLSSSSSWGTESGSALGTRPPSSIRAMLTTVVDAPKSMPTKVCRARCPRRASASPARFVTETPAASSGARSGPSAPAMADRHADTVRGRSSGRSHSPVNRREPPKIRPRDPLRKRLVPVVHGTYRRFRRPLAGQRAVRDRRQRVDVGGRPLRALGPVLLDGRIPRRQHLGVRPVARRRARGPEVDEHRLAVRRANHDVRGGNVAVHCSRVRAHAPARRAAGPAIAATRRPATARGFAGRRPATRPRRTPSRCRPCRAPRRSDEPAPRSDAGTDGSTAPRPGDGRDPRLKRARLSSTGNAATRWSAVRSACSCGKV